MSELPLILQLSADTYADRALIGGKAASLLTLAGIGAAVPPAFVLTTEAYRQWAATPDAGFVRALIDEGITGLEAVSGRKLGAGLIVSVRSGAPVSMPGMMDTVLNAGIGVPAADAEPFIHEARLRFLRQYCELVLGIDPGGADTENDFRALAGDRFPETPRDELVGAAEAVFASWQSSRARLYRRMRKIDDNLGTSVTIQQMVFGNRGANSGSGVAFTRDPTSGAHGLTGEYIQRGQGEEIVAGKETGAGLDGWRAAQPERFAELRALGERLEADTHKVHEIEFTVEEGRLFVLQCRPALLTAKGAARVAVEMVREGRLDRAEAVAYAMTQGFDPDADPNAMGIAPGHEPAGRRRRGGAACLQHRARSGICQGRRARRVRDRRDVAEPAAGDAEIRRAAHDERRRDLACGGSRARAGHALRGRHRRRNRGRYTLARRGAERGRLGNGGRRQRGDLRGQCRRADVATERI